MNVKMRDDFKPGVDALRVGDQVFVCGPGGFGTENPATSAWCTRNPDTCEMIVLPSGTTRARLRFCPERTEPCRWPVGTCMLWPEGVGDCPHARRN